jgi:Spy/CpxP family protein refolding chaperone
MNLKIILMLAAASVLMASCSGTEGGSGHNHSQYAGKEKQAIKALSETEVTGYLNGDGMSLALAAELNGYPGPKHILENEGPLGLTAEQKEKVQEAFDGMKRDAQSLGKRLVDKETELDRLFAEKKIDGGRLPEYLAEIGRINAELRSVHLRTHLEMVEVLTPEQTAQYNRLRGYTE